MFLFSLNPVLSPFPKQLVDAGTWESELIPPGIGKEPWVSLLDVGANCGL